MHAIPGRGKDEVSPYSKTQGGGALAHLVDRDSALQYGAGEHRALPLDGEAVVHGKQERALDGARLDGDAQKQLRSELIQPLCWCLVLPCDVQQKQPQPLIASGCCWRWRGHRGVATKPPVSLCRRVRVEPEAVLEDATSCCNAAPLCVRTVACACALTCSHGLSCVRTVACACALTCSHGLSSPRARADRHHIAAGELGAVERDLQPLLHLLDLRAVGYERGSENERRSVGCQRDGPKRIGALITLRYHRSTLEPLPSR
jgi:hypothetical protein